MLTTVRSQLIIFRHDVTHTDTATLKGVMDIEDLVKHGTEAHVCPYYLSRQTLEEAEVIVIPYNYLVNPETRRAQKVGLNGNIVIVDEVHIKSVN